ncbi:alpha/beta fold hydrolase [Deinococcus cavernae]|uniref:Alpha/beta fold hydrolase n=1 Tax=Deinococcus cavernae TaxID=2320857 RepID=A0A418VB25_9DEIO|nr:alpha/beta fold hydrolase [Deinococcus cavernae]RJF73236.1 alpha/beta fold hydrolase [Deinococcus cavernae]
MTEPLPDPPAASELAGVPCRVERRVWAGVPCLLERPLTDRPLRAVCVVFHGAWASKEGKLGVYSALSAQDVLVVLPDAALHGERQEDTPAGLNAREYVWESVSRTVVQMPALLDAVAAEFGALPVWVIGSSMGGYVALTLPRTEGRVQKVAAAITSGVWREPLVERPALRYFLDFHRPVEHAASFPPRPLLLISGAQDAVFPTTEHHAPTAQAFKRAYGAAGVPHLFQEQVLPNVGHYTSQRLRCEVIRFLTGS